MKLAFKWAAMAVVCAATGLSETSDRTTVTDATPEIAAGIRLFEAWLQGQMTDRQLPGVAVGVVHDQALLWAKGFGYADVESKTPITPKTLFRVASNTKPFTAVAIMQLRDAGKLRLDDPVSQYLPWFKLQSSGSEEGRAVTIENLLTHGSGLPRESSFTDWNTRMYPNAEDVRSALASQKAAFPPETRAKYSNLGFILAGMVVEAVSDMSYTEWMQRSVLGPLGMISSSIDRNVEGLASGYGRRMPDNSREKIPFFPLRAMAPAGGLTSNVEDLARFVSLQFRRGRASGAQILAGTTLQEMHRVHFIDASWKYGAGLGFVTVRVNDRSYVGHTGHVTGFTSVVSFLPDSKVGVIVLTNADDSRPQEIVQRAHQIIGAAIARTVPPAKKLWNESWRRYAGHYRNAEQGDLYVVALKDELVIFDPALVDPVNGGLKVVPQPDGSSFILDGNPNAWDGEPVRFVEKGGRIEAVILGTAVRYDRAE